MKIDSTQSKTELLKELGDRIACRRISIRLTQQEAANKAGISLRTWVCAENGTDVRISTLIEILRVLNLLDNLNVLLPERTLSPVDIVKLQGKERKRVRKSKEELESQSESNTSGISRRKPGWKWGDEK